MLTKLRSVAAVVGLALVAGCTAGNGALEPGFTSANLNANKAQLAVGVATFSDGSLGVNMVGTFRQVNGLSATLLNTPTITGPFTVPATATGTKSNAATFTFGLSPCKPSVDAGTSHITGSAQSLVTASAACSTFGQGGGLLSYGFSPENSTTAQAPGFIQYGDYDASGGLYGLPFFGDPCVVSDCIGDSGTDANGNPLPGYSQAGYAAFRGGPPAFPNARLGTYPSGFIGFTLGYTVFAMAPVAGAYNLSLNIPSANNAGATITAPTFNLASVAGLPAFAAAPTFSEDGTGGGTASCVAPAGVTETVVELFDEMTDAYYTQVVSNGGAVTAAFADNLGPGSGTAGATLNTGDAYEVTCIGADYPLYEVEPTQNKQQTPTLVGGAGQTDIAFAPALDGFYGAAAGSRAKAPAFHRTFHPHRAI